MRASMTQRRRKRSGKTPNACSTIWSRRRGCSQWASLFAGNPTRQRGTEYGSSVFPR